MPKAARGKHVGGNDGAIQRRAFISRTGMVLEMLESPSGEQLTLSTNDGKQRLSLVQQKDTGIQLVSEGPITVTAKKDITVTAEGDIAMSGKKISIAAKADVEITGMNVK